MSTASNLLNDGSTYATLIRAGVDVALKKGIDNVAVSDVIARAKVSRPTFYSYFDDVPSLWAELWVAVGNAWFSALTSVGSDDELFKSKEHAVLTEVFLVAPRVPELLEVMQADLSAMWSSIREGGETSEARQCWNIGLALGATTGSHILTESAQMLPVIDIVSRMPNSWTGTQRKTARNSKAIPIVTAPRVDDVDDVSTRLLEASVSVVAHAGVSRASMTRIARAARVTTGSSRPRFPALSELILRGFDRMIDSVVSENMTGYDTAAMGTRPWDAFSSFTISGLHPSRSKWRRYRQEMHVAARVDSRLASHLRRSFTETNGRLHNSLVALQIDRQGAQLAIMLNHVLAVGFGAMVAMDLPVANVNHFIVSDWLEAETGLSMG